MKSKLDFRYFEKQYDARIFCISEITDFENVVRKLSKKSRFDKQHGKRAQALLKSVSEHLYHTNRLLPRQLSWKKSLLLSFQILGLLVNTLAADDKYPLLYRDNLTIPIRMQLFNQEKTFSEFFPAF